MTYHVGITKHGDDPYQIAIHKTRHDMMMGHSPRYHEVKSAEELLDLLVEVYGWSPEEWDEVEEARPEVVFPKAYWDLDTYKADVERRRTDKDT